MKTKKKATKKKNKLFKWTIEWNCVIGLIDNNKEFPLQILEKERNPKKKRKKGRIQNSRVDRDSLTKETW